MKSKHITSLIILLIGGYHPTRLPNVCCHRTQGVDEITSHIILSLHCMCLAECCLTANLELKDLPYPVKRKQALLGSNLSGITGAEKSRKGGTRSSGRVPTHHFGPFLRKSKTPNELSAILGHHLILTAKKSVPDFSYCESLAHYVSDYDRD